LYDKNGKKRQKQQKKVEDFVKAGFRRRQNPGDNFEFKTRRPLCVNNHLVFVPTFAKSFWDLGRE